MAPTGLGILNIWSKMPLRIPTELIEHFIEGLKIVFNGF
jgi:hypothetical protein